MGEVIDINKNKIEESVKLDHFSRVERIIDHAWTRLIESEQLEKDKDKDENDSM